MHFGAMVEERGGRFLNKDYLGRERVPLKADIAKASQSTKVNTKR
jgi:hypothetical protein